jgi:PleD family two-component response regulator
MTEEKAEDKLKSKKNILIIDDDFLFQNIIKKKSDNSRYNTDSCSHVLQASLYLENKKPDLILLDILMPGMSGLEFLSYLRFNLNYLKIPVIVTSVLYESQVLDSSFKLGANDFFQKPVNIVQLFNRIDNLLSEKT